MFLVSRERTSIKSPRNLIRKQTTQGNTGQQEIREWPAEHVNRWSKRAHTNRKNNIFVIYLVLILLLGLWDLSPQTRD